MVKVTVLYNLPPGTDEAEFVRWRSTTHHAANVARPGLVRSDFYRVLGTPQLPEQAEGEAPYRFVTEAYWPDLAAFRSAWNDPAEQARLVPAVAKIGDALFLLSEEVQTFVAAPEPAESPSA